jgi:trimeric autotransporter adhesin
MAGELRIGKYEFSGLWDLHSVSDGGLMGNMPSPLIDPNAAEALTQYRRLQSQTIASSFQLLSRDQFGSQIYNRSNTTLASLSTPVGSNAVASGNRSTAVGSFANAREDSAVALGVYALGLGPSSVAIGDQANATKYRSVAIGPRANATGVQALAFGILALASGQNALAMGVNAIASVASSIAIGVTASASSVAGGIAIGSTAMSTGGLAIGNVSSVTGGDIALGGAATASGTSGIAVGGGSTASATNALAVGHLASASATAAIAIGLASASGANSFVVSGLGSTANQVLLGGSANHFSDFTIVQGPNFQCHSVIASRELTTIASAAFTDTTIAIPANVIVKYVSVRVTVTIPTAATFTVTGATSGTAFNTAAVGTAAGTTNKGNAAGAYYNATLQNIRITPNALPANTNGRVRVTICYEDVTPPAS